MYLKTKLGVTEGSDTEVSEVEPNADNDVTFDDSDVADDQLTSQNLNHAEIRWLKIGEKLGTLLLRIKSWLSA